MDTVLIKITEYDSDVDTFTLRVPGCKDSTIAGTLLPVLIGEYGEPDELVGRTFEAKLP